MRLADAVRSNQGVAIFGDYDADGIVGAAILHSVLSLKGLRPRIELPCRTQGYGLTNEAVHRFSRAGVQLLITVDNGIAAHDAIRLAYRLRIDVIVIDHHFKQSNPPQATVHVDKRQRGRTPRALWRWMKRRAAVEPSIGHVKNEHRLDRNRLKGVAGDAINAILAAAAMNFQKLLGTYWRLFLSCLICFCRRILSLQGLQAHYVRFENG
jgi:hypothetical protein